MKRKRKLLIIANIVILLVIAVFIGKPYFIKARNKSVRDACHNNLRVINSAIYNASMAQKWLSDSEPDMEIVFAYISNKDRFKKCPSGKGKYITGKVTDRPWCTFHGKLLPEE